MVYACRCQWSVASLDGARQAGDKGTVWKEYRTTMPKQAGGRPSKSGARRELKTFRLVPDALEHLERLANERGGSTSDVLNEILMESQAAARPRLLEVVSPVAEPGGAMPAVSRFRVLNGGGKPTEEGPDPRVAHELERLRDGLAGVLAEIEDLMAEQIAEAPESAKKGKQKAEEMAYAGGFRDGMLEALETAYALLQSEMLITESV